MTEDESKDLKRKLWDWGNAIDNCKRKQDEIQRLESLIRDMRSGSSQELTGMPRSTNISNTTQNAAIKIIDSYMTAINKIAEDIGDIMGKKIKMDTVISGLSHEQKKLLELRYVKGYGWEYIPLQMHYSKRQCFNIHDETLKNIALNCTKLDL